MTQEKSNSVWTWLLPLLAGAMLTLVSDQLADYFQEKERHHDAHVDRLQRLFHEVSTTSGELYYVTRNILGELHKPESFEKGDLMKEYDQLLVKLNTNYLRDLSLLEFFVAEEYADRYGEKIISPLMQFNPGIEEGMKKGAPIPDFDQKMKTLDGIREEIIEFNKKFIHLLENKRKGG